MRFTSVPEMILTLCGFQIAEKIRPTVDKYNQAFPALLEIPSKDHPYGEWSSFEQLHPGIIYFPSRSI